MEKYLIKARGYNYSVWKLENERLEDIATLAPQAVSGLVDLASASKSEVQDLDIAPKVPCNFFVQEKED